MTPLDLPYWLVLPSLFVLGAVLGSFLNVCIYRLPQHEYLSDQLRALGSPRWSFCPGCKQTIQRRDNIPIVSWLILGGRCRNCRKRIAIRYPFVELLNGLLFVVLYWMEMPENVHRGITDSCLYADNGPQIVHVWSTAAWLHWRYVYHLFLIESLLVATFIDFDTMTIPDGATVPAMIVGIIGGGALGQVFLVPVWFQSSRDLHFFKRYFSEWMHPFLGGPGVPDIPPWILEHPHLHGLAVSVAGFLVGGGVVWSVRIIGKWILRREAMGFGDVTLMAAIGSFLGWQAALVVFFVAPFCAIVVALGALIMRKGQEIPYGPYLSMGTLVVLLGWPRIWPAAERVFQSGILIVFFFVLVPVLLAACLQALQLVKRLIGLPAYPQDEYSVRWLSSDTLSYLAGENVDDRQGRWKTDRWPGLPSGRGQTHEDRWRRGSAGSPPNLHRRGNGRM